jgi:sortase (surface protein transpeptidase)
VQPATRRLPLTGGSSRSRRVAKKIYYSFGRYRLEVALRNFKTNKHRRSKKTRQLVLNYPFFGYREIAIINRSRRHSKVMAGSKQHLTAAAPVILGAFGAIFFFAHLIGTPQIELAHQHGQVKAASTIAAAKSYPRSTPTQILIPKIDINAQITPIGLKPDGTLAVPDDFHAAGWYTGSPTPGEIGPSIIDGHVDNVAGLGVFWRLRELAAGDSFQIVRADSSIVTFKVDSIEQFPQDKFPTAQVYGKVGYAALRLITCGGVFNSDTHHYSDNIVVFGRAI